MKVTRDVILDLLPLYLADEASEDTRDLVEHYLETVPQLAQLAQQAGESKIPDDIGCYHWETAVSEHPAYPFRMSTRDLARFGWLYLHQGRWAEQQLIPAGWIAASTRPHAPTSRDADWGYLWWVLDQESSGYAGFVARGGDTQMLAVLSEENLVFVHMANTYAGETVSQDAVWALLDMVLAAKTGAPTPDPTLVPLPPSPPAEVVPLASDQLADYAHTYIYPDGRQIEVQLIDETLVMDFGYGQFDLLPLPNNEFLVADTRERIAFQRAVDGGLQMVYETLPGNPFPATGPAIAATAS